MLALFNAESVFAAKSTVTSEAHQAKAYYTQGQKAYDNGDYSAALEAFESAYQLRPLPGLLFNMGQCHRKRHAYAEAEDYFQRYLKEGAKGKQRSKVRLLIREMRRKQKLQKSSGSDTSTQEHAAQNTDNTPSTDADDPVQDTTVDNSLDTSPVDSAKTSTATTENSATATSPAVSSSPATDATARDGQTSQDQEASSWLLPVLGGSVVLIAAGAATLTWLLWPELSQTQSQTSLGDLHYQGL